MNANPFLGVFFHWLGGLASASFYIPYRGVKKWSWETYWLVGGVFSWIIAPMFFAWLLVPDVWNVIRSAPARSLGLAYFFGVMWGLGGLTFGLTMRYLGIALGMAVALGYCAAFGTLMPPIFSGEIGHPQQTSGQVCSSAWPSVWPESPSAAWPACPRRELTEEQKGHDPGVQLRQGDAGGHLLRRDERSFAYGLAAGKPIGDLARPAWTSSAATTSGRICPCWSSFSGAGSPPTSSGVSS